MDVGLIVIAFFQFITLDNGVKKDVLIDSLKCFTEDDIWLDNFNNIINNKNYCIENDNLIKLKHYQYAKEVLHHFISNNKDENINEFIEDFIKNLLINPKYEIGYSNLLEFIWFDYKALRYKLNKKNYSLNIINNLFNKSSSHDEVKIKNLNSLIRFTEENDHIIEENINIVYSWIENVNRKTAYPLENLINTLNNKKFNLNITKKMMDDVFDKINTSKLSEKSIYSGLYNRLNMFTKLKTISKYPLKISLSNIKIGVEHYHFAKVISDLGYIDSNWTNECIKDNIKVMAETLNNNLFEALEYYNEIFNNNFGLISRILGTRKVSNKYAKKLAKRIETNKVIEAFSELTFNDSNRFSHFLLFLGIYDKNKLDIISSKADYNYLKKLFPNDFLDIHEHKIIVHILNNKKSEKYSKYIEYLIENCKILNKKLLSLNPELSLIQLKLGKNYKMDFHGNEGYKFTMNLIKWLEEEKEYKLIKRIIKFNKEVIRNSILNNISNCDNSKEKKDLLLYIYKHIPILYKEIFTNKEKVNKHIQKLYILLKGKKKEKEIAKLYACLIKEFTTEHIKGLNKLEKKFPSIKESKITIIK